LSAGKYDRGFIGKNAAGASLSFAYHILKNKLGVFTFSPFAEGVLIGERSKFYNQSGVGAVLMYRLWRLPFPIGVNYTYNLFDGSYIFTFALGGMF
jgi:hypothetical protein